MSLKTVTKRNRLPGLISRVDGFRSYNWWRRGAGFRKVSFFCMLKQMVMIFIQKVAQKNLVPLGFSAVAAVCNCVDIQRHVAM